MNYIPNPPLKPMTRCECHDREFQDVLRVAVRHDIEDFDELLDKADCGKTCTACHCDLKRYLALNGKPQRDRALEPA